MIEHTPTPWEVLLFNGGSDYCDILQKDDGLDDAPIVVAQRLVVEDAEYIVKCVNLHDELVGLLAEATGFANRAAAMSNVGDLNRYELSQLARKLYLAYTKTKKATCEHKNATFEDVPNGGPAGFYCPDCGEEVYKQA